MAIKADFSPVPPDTMIFGADHYYSTDGKKTHLNNNVLVIGRSGSGKTRHFVKPNLLQCNGSYVVSDPKGQLYREFKDYFLSRNYQVFHSNFREPQKSMKYNPFAKAKNSDDIRKIVHSIVYSNGANTMQDPFWEAQAMELMMGLGLYWLESPKIKPNDKSIPQLQKLLALCSRNKALGNSRSAERYQSPMSILMEEHHKYMESIGKHSLAYEYFNKVDVTPEKTYMTILATAFSKLVPFESDELSSMLSGDDFDFKILGKKKSILFVEVSDIDRSADSLCNLYYTQLLNELTTYADTECPDGELPVPVTLMLDDFSTNVTIDGFPNLISNVRSRKIACWVMCQDSEQLFSAYGNGANTIIGNCSSILYLGGNCYHTAADIAHRVNRPVHEILNMPTDSCWLCRIGQKPQMVDLLDINEFMKQKGFFDKDQALSEPEEKNNKEAIYE